jgi:CRISPR/Cas system-associated protein Csm6
MSKLQKHLKGGDLRSIGKVETIVKTIKTQYDFDNLFKGLFNNDRLVIMRTADAIEKNNLSAF